MRQKKNKSAASNFMSNSGLMPPSFGLNMGMNQSTNSKGMTHEKATKTQSNQSSTLKSNSNTSAPSSMSSSQTPQKIDRINNEDVGTESSNENQNEGLFNSDSEIYSSVSANHFLSAFQNGHEIYKYGASLSGVKINGPNAQAGYGCLSGPSIKNLMKNDPELQMRYTNSVDKKIIHLASSVINEQLQLWTQFFRVPNLMWYPHFAFIPGPIAPPSPNIPCPLQDCAPSGLGPMKASKLKNAMSSYLSGDERNDHNIQVLDAIADKVSFQFYLWTQSTYLQGIIGQGPVPGFRPPFGFGGPVIGGSCNPCMPFN